MSENQSEIHSLIVSMYELAGLKAEESQDFQGENCEIPRELHAEWLNKQFKKLSSGMISQDCGQPWFLFWLTNGIEVCNLNKVYLSQSIKDKCVSYLRQCHNDKEGGFSGAPGLQSHLASTYAAMMAIINIGTPEAYQIVDVEKMRKFLHGIKNNLDIKYEQTHPNNIWIQKDKETGTNLIYKNTHEVIGTLPGSVAIHENGEMDMRGVYCALVVADILNIMDETLTRGMAELIAGNQTYEGGIACAPYGEAHAGYTFCGFAALLLLKKSELIDQSRMLEWLTQRQIAIEGGFNGRINKLVDSCYNFWAGATFELLDIATQGKSNLFGEWLFNQHAVQAYTIYCCQNLGGGVKDKPTKYPDPYHTSYGLSGCSFAQHKADYHNLHAETSKAQSFQLNFDGNYSKYQQESNSEEQSELEFDHTSLLGGILDNKLRRLHPIYNARYDYVAKAKDFYRLKKTINEEINSDENQNFEETKLIQQV